MRTNLRNGHRRADGLHARGDIDVAISKTRTGLFFPSLLEPRRRVYRS